MLARMLKAMLIFLACSCHAVEYKAGKDYQVLNTGPDSKAGGRVQVMEFFSYGCPWCFKLEKPLHNFVKEHNGKVTLKQVPVVFQPGWQVYAKAYYTAKRLNQLEKLSPLIFDAIQTQNKPLKTDKAMVAFLVKQGVDKEAAENAFFHSPTIDSDVKQGSMAMVKYRIRGVPAVVVNGRYKLDLSMAGGVDRFFDILTYLITKSQ